MEMEEAKLNIYLIMEGRRGTETNIEKVDKMMSSHKSPAESQATILEQDQHFLLENLTLEKQRGSG